jgi:uncharacterized protein YjbJ (UPF0337 family)
MIKQRTREELYDKFRQGAIPSGADFADFIKSQLNLMDDGIDIPEDAKEPICFRAHGDEENILDFADSDGNKIWRISGCCEDESTLGLNIQADEQSKLYIERETGNVGISTDEPEAKLHIIQNNSSDALRIDDRANDETPFVVNSDGQVGLGISSPTAQLHISYSGSGDILRVDDTEDDSTPLVVDDSGNVGIGLDDPLAKLTIEGGVAIGKNFDPGNSNLYVDGNLEVGGTVVFSNGSGVGGIEINAPLTSKTNTLTIKDNVNIIADANQSGSAGNLSATGHTTLGTYNAVYENQKVLTVNGRIRSGDDGNGTEQYELEINDIFTINRNPKNLQAVVKGGLNIYGSTTLGDTLDDAVCLNGTVKSEVGPVMVGDDLLVKGTTTLGDTAADKIYLNGTVSSDIGDVVVNDNLVVHESVTLGSDQTDNIYLNGKVSSNVGDVTINDNLVITGSATLGDAQTDNIFLNGKVSSNVGDVTINDNLVITGSATLGDAQTDDIFLNGKVSSTVGEVFINDNLTVSGSATLGDAASDNIYLNGTVSSTTGAVNIADSLNVNNDLNVNGALSFDNSSTKVSGVVVAVDNLDDGVITTEGAVKRYVDDRVTTINNAINTVNSRVPIFYRDNRYVQMVTGHTYNKGWGDGYNSHVDIYPPAGFTMSQLVYFSVSPSWIMFSGDVNGDDTLSCVAYDYGSYIRCFCGNSEQRGYGTIAFYGLWKY